MQNELAIGTEKYVNILLRYINIWIFLYLTRRLFITYCVKDDTVYVIYQLNPFNFSGESNLQTGLKSQDELSPLYAIIHIGIYISSGRS
jgi:hypothetical protein